MLPAYRRRVRILTARDLVVGPRGRVLYMAVAHRLDARVWSTWLQAARNPGDDRRRTDLIRYGKFTTSAYLWAWKGGVETGTAVADKYNIFPLPGTDLTSNPNLHQNPGY